MAPAAGLSFPATKGDGGASHLRVVYHLQRRRSPLLVKSDGRSIKLFALDTEAFASMSNHPLPDTPSNEVTFSPRVATQDGLDALLAVLIGGLLTAILFGMPALIAFLITHSVILAATTFIIVYLIFLAFSVWSLSASDHGLRLHRLLGGPRLIPWGHITSVREVSRAEVILDGWFWPLFPRRESTPCLSSLGHFRIDFDGRHIYYPPRDVDQFRQFVAARLTPPPAA